MKTPGHMKTWVAILVVRNAATMAQEKLGVDLIVS